MSRGVVLIAHNNEKYDYYKMATFVAERVNRFLKLPVTIITDEKSNSNSYSFEKTIIVEPDSSNYRKKNVWINKGRYKVFDLSPYDETLVLDTDYILNSNQLLNLFDHHNDFACHKKIRWLLEDVEPEMLSKQTVHTLWATVMMFRKTNRTEQVFQMIKMVQENYEHYANIYKFLPYMYRNDYALTIALKTVNGHMEDNQDYINHRLLHVSTNVKVSRINDLEYLLIAEDQKSKKNKYMLLKDVDFHMINKTNYMELFE